ncbi:MAG: transcription-repair coupling factor [Tissierellia bacterium]|nr:transcription-repair coupling factor [Tissierellia bacterium]
MKKYLSKIMLNLKAYKNIIKDIENGLNTVSVQGIIDEVLAQFVFSLGENLSGNKLLVAYDDIKARSIYDDMKNLGCENIYYFPAKELFFYKREASSNDLEIKRLEAMNSLLNRSDSIVITTAEALTEKIMKPELFIKNSISLNLNTSIEIEKLNQKLVDAGYERVDIVEGKGQFSSRGGLIDIFAVNRENPVRIEFFDIEIDSLREFDVLSQRSFESINELEISPAKDMLIEDEDVSYIIENIDKMLKASKLKGEVFQKLDDKFKEIAQELKERLAVPNRELLYPFLKEHQQASILDYLKAEELIIIDEPRRFEDALERVLKDTNEYIVDLALQGEVFPEHKLVRFDEMYIYKSLKNKTKLTISNILRNSKFFKPASISSFNMKSGMNYHGRMEDFKTDIEDYLYKGYKVLILAGTESKAMRLKKNLNQLGISASLAKSDTEELKSGQIIIDTGSLRRGFEYIDLKFVVINQREIYSSGKRKRRRDKKRGDLSFEDLKPGDYIVHESHGIGKYVGIEKIEIAGSQRDYLKLEYFGSDRLFIPTDQMQYLHKYVGKEANIRLHKLDSVEWQKSKTRVKKAVEDMAEDLILLYAKREKMKGHKFDKDTDWQNQFEQSFPYEETEGQLESISEIKADMEKERSMDRLLCADVGYGKTEVAFRAAFKAVMDNKQVAILVPTTLLARQHYNTAIERFREFPMRIGILSRFQSEKEIKETLEGVRRGLVDIVIGTHRLLSDDVKFKDLGLLIIDEEQRFGVKHKEKLRMIKENVDTLTLTATPIPRTLQMAMSGIRDMSVIDEPPLERYPVQTYVTEYNPQMIRDAILKEIRRNGQVYFVYNRVETISKMAAHLMELVPEAEFAIAHGQMNENALENTMMNFVEKKADVLICTTIIETGLDIPNVNTIIVFDADRFGLAQLYQLRGRVGRSNRIAYAYFTYERNKQLTEVAEKRLLAIKEFTEFGSGYKIAIRDLEIRGAGNLLGARQHGHIDAIGYDLYVKFLKQAVDKLQGKEIDTKEDFNMEINIDAYIPNDYIESEEQRLEIYKKISLIQNEKDYRDTIDEIIDRYSDMPQSVSNLIDLAYLKTKLMKYDIISAIGDKDNLKLIFDKDVKLDFSIINQLIGRYGSNFKFKMNPPQMELKIKKYLIAEAFDFINNF